MPRSSKLDAFHHFGRRGCRCVQQLPLSGQPEPFPERLLLCGSCLGGVPGGGARPEWRLRYPIGRDIIGSAASEEPGEEGRSEHGGTDLRRHGALSEVAPAWVPTPRVPLLRATHSARGTPSSQLCSPPESKGAGCIASPGPCCPTRKCVVPLNPQFKT